MPPTHRNFQSLLDPQLRHSLNYLIQSEFINADIRDFIIGYDWSKVERPSPELRTELEKKFGKENVDKILTLLEGA